MANEHVELRIDCRADLGEMPVWCDATSTLYWVDVVKPGRLFHWQTNTGAMDFWEFDDLVTGVSLVAEGGLLVRGSKEVWLFNPATGHLRTVFALPKSATPMRFNDGHCDRAGRLWVRTMRNEFSSDGAPVNSLEYCGEIYVIGATTHRATAASLGCPNAICWSPDGGKFYIADSCDGWLYSYRFDGASGTISERSAFSYVTGLGIPDGAAVDCDGNIWNARWGAGAVVRIDPHGQLDRIVRLPTTQPTACCFGDSDRRTLYITSARHGLTFDQLRLDPFAGGVYSIRVDVSGLDVAKFASVG